MIYKQKANMSLNDTLSLFTEYLEIHADVLIGHNRESDITVILR